MNGRPRWIEPREKAPHRLGGDEETGLKTRDGEAVRALLKES